MKRLVRGEENFLRHHVPKKSGNLGIDSQYSIRAKNIGPHSSRPAETPIQCPAQIVRITVNASTTACEKASQWCEAIQLLHLESVDESPMGISQRKMKMTTLQFSASQVSFKHESCKNLDIFER